MVEPRFQTTSWSLIARARDRSESARAATAALCQQYWQPLYVYARRRGLPAHEAEDVIQGFLLHVVENDVFARADETRGRFRTFLLSALRQHMARRHRDAHRRKRSPDGRVVSMDVDGAERLVARTAPGDSSPDAAFERAWAMAQLDMAWGAVEEEYRERGKSDLFAALRPVVGQRDGRPVRQIAAEFGMSEGAANVAAHRLRRRFGEALRAQVALTVASTEEIDDEISRLRAAISGHLA